MAAQKTELIGLKEANRALKALPEFARDEAQQASDTTAFHFSRMASAAAPRREGTLAANITWASRPRSLSAVVLINEREAFHWKFQEFGTVHHGAQPFLRPTAVQLAPDHQRRLIQGLERARARMAAQSHSVGSRVL